MKTLATICCLLIFNQISAQRYTTSNLEGTFALKDATFSIYSDSIVMPSLKRQLDALYNTPENTLHSELSANTKEWVDEVYFPLVKKTSAEEIVEKVKYLNNISSTLVHKLEFTNGHTQVCLIKAVFNHDGSPVFSACLVYEKMSDRWYRVSVPDNLQALGDVVWYVKSSPLKQLLIGINTGSIIIDNIIAKTQTTFGFDPARFIKLTEEWRQNNEQVLLETFLD
jgi:hypothetical protein